jgi:hypothetical protein
MEHSTAVCVIGPGRAGTSLTMRALNLLGVYVGPEEGLVEPGPGGPKGFWERRDLIALNDRLLRSQGGSWRRPPRPTPGWETAADLAAERAQAGALLEQAFAGHELWGWKDPRASLTTAFWQRLVPDLRYVICLRNPIDAADSISPPAGRKQEDAFYYSRRGPKRERAYRLWLTYVASALVNTSGRPRIFVSYEDHFDDRRATAERLARFVGREPPPPGSAADRLMADFVDPDLRHYRTTPEEVVGDDRLPDDAAALYLVSELLKAVASPAGEAGAAGEEALQACVDRFARSLLEEAGAEPGSRRGGSARSAPVSG